MTHGSLKVAGVAASIIAGVRFVGAHHIPYPLVTFAFLFWILLFAYALWKITIHRFYLNPLRHLPHPPNDHGRWGWFWGQTWAIAEDPFGTQRRWIEDDVPNDGLLAYFAFGQSRVLLTSPSTLSEVMIEKPYIFEKPALYRQSLARILGIGLLVSEGEEHKRQRKSLMPAFNFRHIKDLAPVFWSKSYEMVKAVGAASRAEKSSGHESHKHSHGAIEVNSWASRATLDIIGVAGLGQEFDALSDHPSPLVGSYHSIYKHTDNPSWVLRLIAMYIPFWILGNIPSAANKNVVAGSKAIKQACREMILERKRSMCEKGDSSHIDIISAALRSGAFGEEELVNHVMTFLLAGHETSAAAMTWAIWLLCLHPDVQAKLRAEIRATLPPLTQDMAGVDTSACHYLRAVCAEVLRLWAPVPVTARTTTIDTTIGGHFIPKGTAIMLSPLAVNVSKRLWGEDASEFKPERWLGVNGKANKHGGADSPYSFMTFLHGPRSCIGQRFAEEELACLLAGWIGRLETEFEDSIPRTVNDIRCPKLHSSGVVVFPRDGVWVKVRQLEGW
ncbi:cytochrome P450 78A3 [Cadophora sp. DSE1049]|nr:cytochrome P450 78A3 [Cadophora sp. DSE1049]